MGRLNEPLFGIEKWPDGRCFETVPADNEQGFLRREITLEEYQKKLNKARNMFK